MDIKLDIIKLKKEIKNKRGNKSIRTISKEANLKQSIFMSIDLGEFEMPSMITFVKLCSWLNIEFKEFIIKTEKEKPKTKVEFETKMYEIDGDTVTVDEPLHKILNILGRKLARTSGFEIGENVDLIDTGNPRGHLYYKLALTAYLFNLQTGELD